MSGREGGSIRESTKHQSVDCDYYSVQWMMSLPLFTSEQMKQLQLRILLSLLISGAWGSQDDSKAQQGVRLKRHGADACLCGCAGARCDLIGDETSGGYRSSSRGGLRKSTILDPRAPSGVHDRKGR
jgi:hypothetical protein